VVSAAVVPLLVPAARDVALVTVSAAAPPMPASAFGVAVVTASAGADDDGFFPAFVVALVLASAPWPTPCVPLLSPLCSNTSERLKIASSTTAASIMNARWCFIVFPLVVIVAVHISTLIFPFSPGFIELHQ
jgi:hypothetical protein